MDDLHKQKVINEPVLILVGPTAIGKTSLALDLAERFNCEIVSVDSMQVYRYMNIGTAKPTPDERQRIKHHLINIINPDQHYDAAMFAEDALLAIRDIVAKGKTPLLTGGTGLYLRALTEGFFPIMPINNKIRCALQERLKEEGRASLYMELQQIDKKSAARIHWNDTHRLLRALEIFYATGVPWSHYQEQETDDKPVIFSTVMQIGLTCERWELYKRIELRTKQMLDQGIIKEVESLLRMGYSASLKSMKSIGYKHINNYLAGMWDKDKAIELLMRDTRRYAKRQITWFKKIPSILWFKSHAEKQINNAITQGLFSKTTKYRNNKTAAKYLK